VGFGHELNDGDDGGGIGLGLDDSRLGLDDGRLGLDDGRLGLDDGRLGLDDGRLGLEGGGQGRFGGGLDQDEDERLACGIQPLGRGKLLLQRRDLELCLSEKLIEWQGGGSGGT
jgi:hypothetical protein